MSACVSSVVFLAPVRTVEAAAAAAAASSAAAQNVCCWCRCLSYYCLSAAVAAAAALPVPRVTSLWGKAFCHQQGHRLLHSRERTSPSSQQQQQYGRLSILSSLCTSHDALSTSSQTGDSPLSAAEGRQLCHARWLLLLHACTLVRED